jgi:phospholipid/cholesterol/gamma-HCH transport system substrate-binding protein
MHQKKVELAVGLFILLAIVALAFLAIQVSGLNLGSFNRETYTVKAEFNNVAGLSSRAKVSISGVTVGHVKSIHLDPVSTRAVVTMAIDDSVDYISSDSIAAIKTSGILGDQYLSISVGGAPDIIEDGGWIVDTQSSLVLEDLIGKFFARGTSGNQSEQDMLE